MFDIGWTELLVIGVVALIAIGPKELPGALRAVGHWMGKIRRMASEFQDQFRDAMREAEVADLKKQVDDMTAAATSYTNFDPLESVRKDVEGLMSDKPAESAPPAQADTPESVTSTAPAPVQEFSVPPPDAAAPAADKVHDIAPQAPQPKTGEKSGEGA
jgi:sec-independent protein translocase protein TatB